MLKNRFQSLRELRFQISSKTTHRFVIYWIVCCLILHNLIIRIEEEAGTFNIYKWYHPEEDNNLGDGGNEENDDESEVPTIHSASPEVLFRQKVMADLFNSFHL